MSQFLNDDLNKFEKNLKFEYLKAILKFLSEENFTYAYEKEEQFEIFKIFFSCNETEISIYFYKKDNYFEILYFVDNNQVYFDKENDEISKQRILNQYLNKKLNSKLFLQAKITEVNSYNEYKQCMLIYEKLIKNYYLNKNPIDNFIWTELDKYFGDHFYNICFNIEKFLNNQLVNILKNHKNLFYNHKDNSYSLVISDDLLLRIIFDNDITKQPISKNETWIIIEYQGIWIYLGTINQEILEIINTWIRN